MKLDFIDKIQGEKGVEGVYDLHVGHHDLAFFKNPLEFEPSRFEVNGV
jgi:cytochrome P450